MSNMTMTSKVCNRRQNSSPTLTNKNILLSAHYSIGADDEHLYKKCIVRQSQSGGRIMLGITVNWEDGNTKFRFCGTWLVKNHHPHPSIRV